MDMEQFRARLLIEQGETVKAFQQAQLSAAPVELDQSSVGGCRVSTPSNNRPSPKDCWSG